MRWVEVYRWKWAPPWNWCSLFFLLYSLTDRCQLALDVLWRIERVAQESQTEASFVLITIHTPTPPMDQRMLVGELESVLRPCALSALEKAILYHAAFWRLAIFRSEHQLQVKAYNLKAPMCCVLMFKYQKQQQIYVTKQNNTSWSQMKGHLFLNLYLLLHVF